MKETHIYHGIMLHEWHTHDDWNTAICYPPIGTLYLETDDNDFIYWWFESFSTGGEDYKPTKKYMTAFECIKAASIWWDKMYSLYYAGGKGRCCIR